MRKKFFILCVCVLLLGFFAKAENPQKGLKVFISVDMEGVSGVIHWDDVSRRGEDYYFFRKLMTQETNAAIEGALEAGATEILVRDSHGSARNILPDLLDTRAMLIRDWSGGPLSMMEGIDKTFDAVIFIDSLAALSIFRCYSWHWHERRLGPAIVNRSQVVCQETDADVGHYSFGYWHRPAGWTSSYESAHCYL